ncbi:MAG: 4'-phosphopantetheinyl transferase superfamily protein, partial [Bacteroidota bacterium]
QYGKPYFETSDIQFNISHSHELVVCAITQHNEIGIDVEYPRSIDIQDFKFQMTEGEWNWISTAKDSQAAFYEYWTKKEAVIKAVGKGFSADLKSFDVMGGTKQLILEGQEWHLSEVAIDKNYHCYLAIAGIDYSVKWSRIQL